MSISILDSYIIYISRYSSSIARDEGNVATNPLGQKRGVNPQISNIATDHIKLVTYHCMSIICQFMPIICPLCSHMPIYIYILHIYIYMHVCMHACMHACMYVYIYIYVYLYVYIYMYIYMYIYIYIYTCIYIHVYTYMYIHI